MKSAATGKFLIFLMHYHLMGLPRLRTRQPHKMPHKQILLVIAAGKPQKPNEDRRTLLKANKPIFDAIFTTIKPINPQAIIIIVTNPLDLMTILRNPLLDYLATKSLAPEPFWIHYDCTALLQKKLGVASSSVNAYVLGEHGDSQCAAWSSAANCGYSHCGLSWHTIKRS